MVLPRILRSHEKQSRAIAEFQPSVGMGWGVEQLVAVGLQRVGEQVVIAEGGQVPPPQCYDNFLLSFVGAVRFGEEVGGGTSVVVSP